MLSRSPLSAKLLVAFLSCVPACGGVLTPDDALPGDGGGGPSADMAVVPTGSPSPDAGAPDKLRPAVQLDGRYFPDSAPWYRDVSGAKASPESATITGWMVQNAKPNGWGSGGIMKVDFSIAALDVPIGTAKRTYDSVSGYFYQPDCDTAPVPVPQGGVVEQSFSQSPPTSGFSGYTCAGFAAGDDCHMLFLSRAEHRLYEIYHATIDAQNHFQAGCLAVWDTTDGTGAGRGQQCTSADAAGFPIAPLLFTPEEIKAGHIDHAIRFILPNSMIRKKQYVAPATHATNTTGPVQAGPYGFRMRLRANYPVQNLTPAAQVVARALQKYGMLLADGGNIALTAQNDVLSSVKWTDVGFDSHSLATLAATDFDVIDFGTPTDLTYDCQRTQIKN